MKGLDLGLPRAEEATAAPPEGPRGQPGAHLQASALEAEGVLCFLQSRVRIAM